MIATARDLNPSPPARDERWRRQRRYAAPLLAEAAPDAAGPRVPRWQAWLLTSWIVAVTTCYLGSLVAAVSGS